MSRTGGSDRVLRAHAPAKINLGLRVTGHRVAGELAGYHELESLFLPLDLADEVELRLSPGGPSAELELAPGAPATVPAGTGNLAWRAARAFLETSRARCRIRIRLRKRIPARAGLGGGSSDAGTVLRLLARAMPDALPGGALRELALSLGADVPFFLDPRPAFVAGVGERIEPLARWPELPLVLAAPRAGLETSRVFEVYRRSGRDVSPVGTVREGVARLLALWPAGTGTAPAGGGRAAPEEEAACLRSLAANDLEAAACELCPGVLALRGALERSGALAVGMTGSGPTLFGIFRSPTEARLAAGLPELGAAGFVGTASTREAPFGSVPSEVSAPRP